MSCNDRRREEPRHIVHAFGDVAVSPYNVAEQLDDDNINTGGQFNIVSPDEAGKEILRKKGWTERAWKHYRCKDCGLIVETATGIKAGDEYVDVCSCCGSYESFEAKVMTTWEKPDEK